MKSLKTLVKIHKNKIDELLIKQDKLNSELKTYNNHLLSLKNEMKNEIDNFANNIEFAFIMDNYLESNYNKQKKVQELINSLENELKINKNFIIEEFSLMKKFDIVYQNKLKIYLEESERKSENSLNDSIMMRFGLNKKKNV